MFRKLVWTETDCQGRNHTPLSLHDKELNKKIKSDFEVVYGPSDLLSLSGQHVLFSFLFPH